MTRISEARLQGNTCLMRVEDRMNVWRQCTCIGDRTLRLILDVSQIVLLTLALSLQRLFLRCQLSPLLFHFRRQGIPIQIQNEGFGK
ncbi:MAG: hypothetical protein Nkreftii_002166 [Candidatus Nitrospira kreftii]|uniref:Uncharacterized protein n=1 Tax=Candidatus Nitrospira kreftii TaxID=2652173 RepID=A0A7S8FEH1_9BACT|nr:MAG: hypothetical protein Nkreftii_002166 [Candidatus Nitrospira kreftii]